MMHLCAALPLPKLLSYLLEKGGLYSMDIKGNTPLSYAIECNNTEAIDVIVKYFGQNPENFVVNTVDLSKLLEMQSTESAKLLNSSFYKLPDN